MAHLLPLLWLCAVLPATAFAAVISVPRRLGIRQSGQEVDTDAGASSGPSGGGSYVSQGGVIAIVVIVVIVVILGVASTVLFVLAKRRQWDVRASIKRASRRFTGREGARMTTADRRSKRVGLQMSSMPSRVGQQKRGFVAVEVDEKGSKDIPNKNAGSSKTAGGSWLWRNDWKP